MRAKGYVVGCDRVGGEYQWTVKVKDSTSHHNGLKFVVASLHPGTMLTKPAVDVTFDIQPFGEVGDIFAVDVSLGIDFPADAAHFDKSSSAIGFALVEENGVVHAMYTKCESEAGVIRWLKEISDELNFLAFVELQPWTLRLSGTYGFNDDEEAFFTGLKAMMESDVTRRVMETIISETFIAGQKTGKQN